MNITETSKREILDYVVQHYFNNAQVEKLVLEHLVENTIFGRITTTNDICNFLEQKQLATSTGAVRGTVLRIRHKLLKYREQTPHLPYHLVFPETANKRGYILAFEKNAYNKNQNLSSDPWLAGNWQALRKQGYQGFWKGLSLPDGGRGPIDLFVWITSLKDEVRDQEKFMFLINSPSSKRPRIGIVEGEIKDHVLYMEGKWCVHYEEVGLSNFRLVAQIWPFRRSEKEPVGFSGRFIIYSEDGKPYQEGQVELNYCPTQNASVKEIWTSLTQEPLKKKGKRKKRSNKQHG